MVEYWFYVAENATIRTLVVATRNTKRMRTLGNQDVVGTFAVNLCTVQGDHNVEASFATHLSWVTICCISISLQYREDLL